MHKINLVWDEQCALRSFCSSGEMVCVERMKELARRGLEESLAGHIHPELRNKQQVMMKMGETEQSKAQRGLRCWSSVLDYPGDSVQMAISPWTGSSWGRAE